MNGLKLRDMQMIEPQRQESGKGEHRGNGELKFKAG